MLVSAQAYNYRLSNVCIAISEIDEAYVRGDPDTDAYERVLRADSMLRTLASSAPEVWWQTGTDLLADSLVKFWHCYMMVRVHLRSTLTKALGHDYAYS